jgi:ribosomal protein S18 acetylase RimI-like enzyme
MTPENKDSCRESSAMGNTTSFRCAARPDLPAIVALLADDPLGSAREFVGATVHPDYVAAFEAIDRDASEFLAVAEQGDEVIGCLQISFLPGLSRRGMLRGQIESVRIAAHARGHGLGRRMLEWAVETCRQRGCGLVQLTTDRSRTDALRLYEEFGFVASHLGCKLEL